MNNILKKEIIEGKECPYCKGKTEYVDVSALYNGKYGGRMVYLCRPCIAYVGVHQGSSVSLGSLANFELRQARMSVHWHFDVLWQKAVKEGRKKSEARSSAYDWLSGQMGIPREFTHIAMFDLKLCDKAIEILKPFSK